MRSLLLESYTSLVKYKGKNVFCSNYTAQEKTVNLEISDRGQMSCVEKHPPT